MAFIFRATYCRGGKRYKTKVWSACWRDASGKQHRQSLKTTSKDAAQLKLADLVRGGVPDSARPIAEHLADWRSAMQARGITKAHVTLATGRVRRVAEACGWQRIGDADASAAERWLAGAQPGIAAKTRNDYADCLKAFGRWLAETKRVPASPFATLRHVSTTTDRRHDRRPLPEEDVSRLLAATLASGRSFRRLTGHDRHALYSTAVSTGFRAGELAQLTPELFRLDESPPVVALAARDDKARRGVRQPLPASIVPLLREYLRGREKGKRVWPGTWWQEPAEMLRIDLAAAGIPYKIDGPDGPLYFDFHSWRHQFISRLDRPGITLKQAMQLARHRDPRLTMAVYGKAQLRELSAAADLACPHVLELAPPSGTDGHPDSTLDTDDGCVILPMGRNDLETGEPVGVVLTQGDEPSEPPGGVHLASSSLPLHFSWFALLHVLFLALSSPEIPDSSRRAA